MAARKRSGSSRTATKSSSTTTNTTQSKRRKSNTQPLGLKLLDDNADNNPIIRLYVGNILGRKPSKPAPANIVTPVRHVDIGITDLHIPRKLLQVSRVTASSLELDVYFDQTEANQDKATRAHRKCAILSADICKIVRAGKPQDIPQDSTIVLEEHDVLQVSKSCRVCEFQYRFQVLPVAEETTTISPNLSMASSSEQDEKPSSTELDRLEEKLGFRPYRPTRPMGSTTRNTIVISKSPVARRPKKPRMEEEEEEEEEAAPSQDSDSEDEDEAKNPQKESTMHATLGNTFYKALRTSTPHYGSTLLSLVLSKNEFPTPHLLEELVQLMTFGPTYDDLCFFEGNRLQLAYSYVKELLEEHPQDMGPRFLNAIARVEGGDYWRLLLDQLTVLPYASSDKKAAKESLELRLQQSMEMHAISLKFFLLLLQHSDLGPQVQRDTKPVTRHVARVMAHVWVSRGYWLLNGQVLSNAMDQLTRLLTKVLGQVTNFDLLQEQDLVDMLWSAMDEGFRTCEEEEALTKKRKVLLVWICNLEDLHPLHKKWTTVTDGLVKRARLRKEYNAISKV